MSTEGQDSKVEEGEQEGSQTIGNSEANTVEEGPKPAEDHTTGEDAEGAAASVSDETKDKLASEDVQAATTSLPEVQAAKAHDATSTALNTDPSTPLINSPAPRRPKPPSKGILKPPPPPAKPTLTNRLRDIVTVVGGGAKSLFDPLDETPGAGPSTPSQPPSVGGTLNTLSGRLQMGFSRFVSPTHTNLAGAASTTAPASTPASPLPRSVSLPETGERGKKQPLKRATFLLPTLSITYPISSSGEPWSQKVLEERKRIESTHKTLLTTTTGAQYWTSGRLVALYESACRGREERARVGIVQALEVLPNAPRPRSIHIILRPSDATSSPSSPHMLDTPLNRHAAEAFADVLTAEWGLTELKLENGVIDGDDSLKPILHALLISGTLPTLSLAGNKKIRANGWRLLAVFLKRAKSLRFVDLSETYWDKKSVDYLIQSLNCTRVKAPPPVPEKDTTENSGLQKRAEAAKGDIKQSLDIEKEPVEAEDKIEETDTTKNGDDDTAAVHGSYGSFMPSAPLLKEAEHEAKPAAVQSLRMDGCALRANALEGLAHGIRSSDLKHISLRRNRIGPLGAVPLATMIRDYPDNAVLTSSITPQLNSLQSAHNSSLPIDRSPSPLPYAARRRPQKPDDEAPLPAIPLVTSSPAGGVTSRILPEGYKPPAPPKHPLVMPSGGNSTMQDMHTSSFAANQTFAAEGKISGPEHGGASMALQRSVRALDGVERIGRLLTLDLKSNDIRNGIGYIAQVLKRNRTLKVLNVADNRIDSAGLALLAEALKYNSTLETLDISNNPCCGAQSEGIAALRTAFTVNTSLKRLFLSDTGLTTDGAISLAEFLPESKSLLHLDLTNNPALDTAGILALSVGLKSNTMIRCLDISIPPNNPELAELSQNILQACIRNTELAASALTTKEGKAEGVWGPIKKSTLVKTVKEAEEARAEKERVDLATSPEGQARGYVYTLKPERIPVVAEQTIRDCEKWYEAGRIAQQANGNVVWEPGQLPKDEWIPLLQRARVLRERMEEVIGETTDGDQLANLLQLNDGLTGIIEKSKAFTPPPRLLLPSQIIQPPPPSLEEPRPELPNGQGLTPKFLGRRHMRVHSLEISSPNFSIGDSDNDSDAEELDVQALPRSTSNQQIQDDLAGLGLGDDLIPEGAEGLQNRDIGELIAIAREGQDSPVEKASKAWVEEEGEIFRKGTKLGVIEDEDDDDREVSGEQLKQEILDTPVARSPTRRRMSVDETESEPIMGSRSDREGSPTE